METNKACGYYRNISHAVSHIVSYRFPKQKNKPVGTNLKFNAELNESHDFKPAVVLDTISVEPVGTAGLDVSTETITKTASSSSMCHYTFAKRSISMLLFNILRYIHRRPLHLHSPSVERRSDLDNKSRRRSCKPTSSMLSTQNVSCTSFKIYRLTQDVSEVTSYRNCIKLPPERQLWQAACETTQQRFGIRPSSAGIHCSLMLRAAVLD